MHHGKIVEFGDSEEVFNNPQNDYTKSLLAAIPRIDSAFAR
jgi:ABC-type oligopeptide transport system ATPase subunit